jgi:hypothetical protein
VDAVVTPIEAVFREATASDRIASVSMSHLSIELGHLYKEDFDAGPPRLRTTFARVAPWARTATEICAAEIAPRTARVSTCFLIDDYFTRLAPPVEVVPVLLAAADEQGVRIDYLARESGCARVENIALTDVVMGRVVEDPPQGSAGARPPATQVGWLCNGERAAWGGAGEAMNDRREWTPPKQNSYNRHSIVVDVQLWSDDPDRRTWSCAFLAAVWQLLRLGLIRHLGDQVSPPRPRPAAWPDTWDELPAVVRLNPTAAPFCAYRTFSILDGRFLETEHAVRTILSQIAPEQAVIRQTLTRAGDEGIALPADIVDRIGYVFVAPPRT